MNESDSPDMLEAIDRMVDGELSGDERDTLLRKCNESPGLWRSLALAYVESQTWRQDLSEFSQAVPSLAPSAFETAGTSPNGNKMSLNASKAVADSSPRSSWPWRRSMNYMGMAVAVLISITFGYGFGSLVNLLGTDSTVNPTSSSDSVVGVETSNDGVETGLPQVIQGAPSGSMRSVPFFVQVDGQNAYRRVDVPLLERDSIQEPAAVDDSIPRLLRGLERHGRVTQESQYIPVQLDDGRRAVVPIGNVRIEFDAYQ